MVLFFVLVVLCGGVFCFGVVVVFVLFWCGGVFVLFWCGGVFVLFWGAFFPLIIIVITMRIYSA